MIDSLIEMFSPFSTLSKELQAMFQLERPPSCRAEHGRLEILVRGAGITERPLDERVELAHRLVDAARPLLHADSKRERRRYADRAIAVNFEDEQVMQYGIATSRFTYVAAITNAAPPDPHNGRIKNALETVWPL